MTAQLELEDTLKKMKKYPHLTDMGVLHPEHIDKYAVNSIGYTDVLRIVYERPKGSLLPLSRTYKFPRVQKTLEDSDGTGKSDMAMVSAPGFRAALDELQEIMQAKVNNQDVAGAIVAELKLLEEDIALRAEYIKSLAGKIKPG